MAARTSVLFWRRTDIAGLERLELTVAPDHVAATSMVICLEDGGFRLAHRWRLGADWRVRRVDVDCWDDRVHRTLRLARGGDGDGTGWEVDGVARPDLDGVDDVDLSATPFCNTLPIRRVPATPGRSLTVDTVFIDAPRLTVARSRQRYERLGPHRLRYVDLGLFAGFSAGLSVDDEGWVDSYEGLFERVAPSPGA